MSAPGSGSGQIGKASIAAANEFLNCPLSALSCRKDDCISAQSCQGGTGTRSTRTTRFEANPILAAEQQKLFDEYKKEETHANPAVLSEHLLAIAKHKLEYEEYIRIRLAQGGATKGYQAGLTEVKGETAATQYMLQLGKINGDKYELLWPYSAGTGFDQVWLSRANQTYIIVEAKGPGAGLSTGAAKGDQMSHMWVTNTLYDMRKSPSSTSTCLGHIDRMIAAVTGDSSVQASDRHYVIGKVLEAKDNGGVIVHGNVPDKGIYHRWKS